MTSQMSFGFDWDTSVRQHIRNLPKLPSHIRYVDEYDDDWRTVENPYESDVWQVNFDTSRVNMNFANFQDIDVRYLLKHFIFWLFGRNAPGTARASPGHACAHLACAPASLLPDINAEASCGSCEGPHAPEEYADGDTRTVCAHGSVRATFPSAPGHRTSGLIPDHASVCRGNPTRPPFAYLIA